MIDNVRRSSLIDLAEYHCSYCNGTGLVGVGGLLDCGCVKRRVFRICYNRWQKTQDRAARVSPVQRSCGIVYECAEKDWGADFFLTIRRALNPFPRFVFQAHYVDNWSYVAFLARWPDAWRRWKARHEPECADPKLVNKGVFFHAIYKIQERVGESALKVGVFPFAKYFDAPPAPSRAIDAPNLRRYDPWLNGGHWQEFANDTKWAKAYKAANAPRPFKPPYHRRDGNGTPLDRSLISLARTTNA